jgi:hypothetical protein
MKTALPFVSRRKEVARLWQTNTNEPQLREAIQELEAIRTQLKSP